MPFVSFFRFSEMYTEHYLGLATRERKPKRGASLGGDWEMTRLTSRALGPFCLLFCCVLDTARKFASTTKDRITLKALVQEF